MFEQLQKHSEFSEYLSTNVFELLLQLLPAAGLTIGIYSILASIKATLTIKGSIPNFFAFVVTFLSWQPIVWESYLVFRLQKPGPIRETWGSFKVLWFNNPYLFWFIILATFKFVKVITHTISYCFFTRPALPPPNPTLNPLDVTVIICTVGKDDEEIRECIRTILANKPKQIIISTVGLASQAQMEKVCSSIDPRGVMPLHVISTTRANKREQFILAANKANTKIIAYADDHVFWPKTFLRSALASFEDPQVGLVGTVKRVIRERTGTYWDSFLNYIACIYLERHNFECTATYNIDGGVFVISGRTALARSSIIKDKEYQDAFLNEYWPLTFGKCGPLAVDDDNFTTRWMVNHGYKTVFHNHPDALVTTTLGTKEMGGWTKFSGQLIRWVRTTWRSNSVSLFIDRKCYKTYPWTTYAMFISSFVNYALVYDPLLIYLLKASGVGYLPALYAALAFGKLVKPLSHLLREPKDLLYILGGVGFGYYHSWFKFRAMLTPATIAWTGRKLEN